MAQRPSNLRSGDAFMDGFLRSMIVVDKKYRSHAFTRAHYVSELCATGSTSATELCRWLGYDPDERVRIRKLISYGR